MPGGGPLRAGPPPRPRPPGPRGPPPGPPRPGGGGSVNPMLGQGTEDIAVHGLQGLPVEEPGDALRAECTDLDELMPVASIAEPSLSGEPVHAAKHEAARRATGHDPPVDRRPLDDLGRGAELPAFPDETAEQATGPPGQVEAVPAVAATDLPEVRVHALGRVARNGQ